MMYQERAIAGQTSFGGRRAEGASEYSEVREIPQHSCAILAEIKSVAASSITVLNCFNWLARNSRLSYPKELEEYRPVATLAVSSGSNSDVEVLLKGVDSELLRSFSYQIARCHNEFHLTMQKWKLFGRLQPRDTRSICDVFLRLADFSEQCLDRIASSTLNLSAAERAEVAYLRKQLRDLRQGKTPLIDNGQLRRPKAVFAERDLRVALGCRALLIFEGQSRDVLIANISKGGALIETNGFSLPPNNMGCIELSDGRRLTGRLRWSECASFGIMFDRPLSTLDDLLNPPSRTEAAMAAVTSY